MNAAEYNSPEVVAALIKSGADAKLKNSEGLMAIDYAKENPKLKNSEALRLLEEKSK